MLLFAREAFHSALKVDAVHAVLFLRYAMTQRACVKDGVEAKKKKKKKQGKGVKRDHQYNYQVQHKIKRSGVSSANKGHRSKDKSSATLTCMNNIFIITFVSRKSNCAKQKQGSTIIYLLPSSLLACLALSYLTESELCFEFFGWHHQSNSYTKENLFYTKIWARGKQLFVKYNFCFFNFRINYISNSGLIL